MSGEYVRESGDCVEGECVEGECMEGECMSVSYVANTV